MGSGSGHELAVQRAARSEVELDPFDPVLDSPVFDLSVLGTQPPLRRLPPPEAHGPSNVDPFANINACTTEHLDQLAHILEVRGAQPWQSKMRARCFKAARLAEGMSIVEIGCGTGVVARELARFAGRTGRVVGIDLSPALLDHAARRPSPPGASKIEYVLGDAYNLPFPGGYFDASCSFTLLAHLDHPDRAIREMTRVTGRTVMVFDQDYQTLVFENSNTRLTRKILQHGADYNVVDGWCGRKLPGMLVRHGLEDVGCCPFVYCERDSQSYLITIAERFAALAVRHGVITEPEGIAWVKELHDRSAEGTFFASLNYYFAFGTARHDVRSRTTTMEIPS